MKTYIIFYEDVIDKETNELVWLKNKQYKIISEDKDQNGKDIITCKGEKDITTGIEKDIKNMFFTI